MQVNNIILVELVADEDKILTNLEKNDTFKKITVVREKMADYIEISLEEAMELEKTWIENNMEQEEVNKDTLVDGIVG